MSGIVGTRVPRFVLFGDTVNTASRMQTTATPGSVHVSEDTRALLPHENWTPTGGVQVGGKGGGGGAAGGGESEVGRGRCVYGGGGMIVGGRWPGR
ncbi:guanylyl and adenylyl cyclase family member [Volvox carteri f. nagariensis]|uniref:Guanylyl and adenylyl cyclase family member n=1 Tax=Volvox carteri f. nagariensis TaxID=3068 RepID=D8TJS3_VOLCA|nr:guanylyl and adenylyl cyclase family member [Volvox carteri f. nagariensis]EFJ52422.1 guanylyl and adenylyl cyclase family member [Volvox carteri f. nagariensis]|eukprot:XP_002946495.1 guanylyl and adenylyl cyclase family member [Volvox carteri f. nagariensis]